VGITPKVQRILQIGSLSAMVSSWFVAPCGQPIIKRKVIKVRMTTDEFEAIKNLLSIIESDPTDYGKAIAQDLIEQDFKNEAPQIIKCLIAEVERLRAENEALKKACRNDK
jgi:alanine-alpha-ketoisovalerate/valine-pyruvate aminotransferase